MLSFNNWITYNPTSTSEEEEDKGYNKVSNKKSNIAKIDDNQNPIKLLPIVGKAYEYFLIKGIPYIQQEVRKIDITGMAFKFV